MNLEDLTAYLDSYLHVSEVPDGPGAVNGLQVSRHGEVSKIVAAVDACQHTIDHAVSAGADLLLVHHGLFWGPVKPAVGAHGDRLRTLFQNDVAVYSSHIPLDIHPDVGNNAVLADKLTLKDTSWFGDYHGVNLGVSGDYRGTKTELVNQLAQLTGHSPHLIDTGPEPKRVGVITGAGGSMIADAIQAGVDTLVTGEGPHHSYFEAEEGGINVIYAGHYATETFGVKALCVHIHDRFGIPWEFVDHPTGL